MKLILLVFPFFLSYHSCGEHVPWRRRNGLYNTDCSTEHCTIVAWESGAERRRKWSKKDPWLSERRVEKRFTQSVFETALTLVVDLLPLTLGSLLYTLILWQQVDRVTNPCNTCAIVMNIEFYPKIITTYFTMYSSASFLCELDSFWSWAHDDFSIFWQRSPWKKDTGEFIKINLKVTVLIAVLSCLSDFITLHTATRSFISKYADCRDGRNSENLPRYCIARL